MMAEDRWWDANCRRGLQGGVSDEYCVRTTLNAGRPAHLAQEPGNEVTKHDGLVGLVIIRRRRDPRQIPQIALPLVQSVVSRPGVKEDDLGSTLDQPSTVDQLDASVPHSLERQGERGSGGRVDGFDFHRRGLVAQGSDEGVSTPIFSHGDGGFGLDDGVDTSDLVGDFPSDFKEKRVVDRSRGGGGGHGVEECR